VTRLILILVVCLGCGSANESQSLSEVCGEIERLPAGDAQAFKDWLGPKYLHIITPADLAACLYARQQ
jgi:hypothetical protein